MEKEEGKKEGKKEKEGVKDAVMEVAESKVPPPRPPPPKIPHRDSMLGSPTTPLSRANADVIASDEEACHVTSPQDSNMAAMCDKKLSNSCNSADTCCLGRVNCAKTSKCYSAKGKEKQQQQNKQEEEKDKQQQQQNKQEEGKEKQQQQQNKQKEGKDKQQQKAQGKANSNENGSKFYLKVDPAEDFFENVETTQNDGFMKRSKTSLEENLKVDGNKKNKIKMSFSTSFSWKNKLTGVKNALTNIFISPPDELHKAPKSPKPNDSTVLVTFLSFHHCSPFKNDATSLACLCAGTVDGSFVILSIKNSPPLPPILPSINPPNPPPTNPSIPPLSNPSSNPSINLSALPSINLLVSPPNSPPIDPPSTISPSLNHSTIPPTNPPTDPSILPSIINPSVHPSIHPPTELPISSPLNTTTTEVSNSSTHPSTTSSTHPSVHPSTHSSFHSSTHLSTHPSVHPSTHPSIHSSTNPSSSSSSPSKAEDFVYSPLISATNSVIHLKGSVIHSFLLHPSTTTVIPTPSICHKNVIQEARDRTFESTTGSDNNNEQQLLVVSAQKQIKVVSLPAKVTRHKYEVTGSCLLVAAKETVFRNKLLLLSILSTNHVTSFDLPNLHPLFSLPIQSHDIRTLSISDHSMIMHLISPCQLQKLIIAQSRDKDSTEELRGILHTATQTPEAPKSGFFQSLFDPPSKLDRQALFGSSSSGSGSNSSALRGVATLKTQQQATSAVASEMNQAKMAALERGEKLGELEERTGKMRVSAEVFGSLATQLKNKHKNQKWYHF